VVAEGGFAGRYAPPFPSPRLRRGVPSPDGGPPVAAPAPEPTVPVPAAATATPGPALCRMVSSGGRAMGCRGEALTARKRSLHKCALAPLRCSFRQARLVVSRQAEKRAAGGNPCTQDSWNPSLRACGYRDSIPRSTRPATAGPTSRNAGSLKNGPAWLATQAISEATQNLRKVSM